MLPSFHSSPSVGNFPRPARGGSAFTLVELLVVIGIIIVLMGLLVPAFNALQRAGGVTSAAYDVSGLVQAARSYAIAHNTYVWLGFYEEEAGSLTATTDEPPYDGKGRIVMAAVASIDGTDLDTKETDSWKTILASDLIQIGRVVKIENAHLGDVGAPLGGADPTTLDGRPGFPYDNSDPRNGGNSHYARISSDSADSTKFPFTAQNYTFHKSIRFNPRGEAQVNSTYDMRPVVEIGLQQTHGTTVDDSGGNDVAVQLTGIAGNVKIYRK